MDVLINHPAFGSLWLEDAYYERDYVIGEYRYHVDSPYLPDGLTSMTETMNFPKSCIRKVEK